MEILKDCNDFIDVNVQVFIILIQLLLLFLILYKTSTHINTLPLFLELFGNFLAIVIVVACMFLVIFMTLA